MPEERFLATLNQDRFQPELAHEKQIPMHDCLCLGCGNICGALTVLPIGGEDRPLSSNATMYPSVQVSELPDGPQVGTLAVTNPHDEPLLLTVGELLEGGHQHRMVADSVRIPLRSEPPVAVVCIEHRRRTGGRGHRSANRRASARIRAG